MFLSTEARSIPGELDHGKDCHKLDAGFRGICWPLGQSGNILEAQVKQGQEMSMQDVKGFGRIKLLPIDELSPGTGSIRAQHDLRELDDELGEALQALIVVAADRSRAWRARSQAGRKRAAIFEPMYSAAAW